MREPPKDARSNAAAERLRALRERIDALDEKIQQLISERARCAQEIAGTKAQSGARNFYRPKREVEVLRKVRARNRGPLPDEEMVRLFREIMSACLALESPIAVAFLGPAGTYTQAAAYKHFGHAVETLALASIDEVFREVEAGAAHFGVVPIENSTEGVISHTLDEFVRSPLKICGEVELRIHHHLLGKGRGLKAIRRVVSHSQSLAQCRRWLDANLPGVARVAVASNAEAARLAARSATVAAIAGEQAAELYKLKRLAANIEDEPDNTTRFLVIGALEAAASGDDKTSLLLSGRNRSGALVGLLEPFARHGLNMTRIESRPARAGLWEYVFFVDIAGHAQDEPVRRALAEIECEASFMKLLGSYPRAVV
jgi:chorismate mutase/prephenate dehydratase